MTGYRYLVLVSKLVKIEFRRIFSHPHRTLATIQKTEPEEKEILEEFRRDNPRKYKPIG